MRKELFTFGYSNREISDFINILKLHSINLLIDVRKIPKSRNRPEFNKDALRKILKKNNIMYMHMKELGGLRKPIKDSVNPEWKNTNFRGFADYMQTEEFDSATKRLAKLASKNKTVIMCAEGNPFRCHRLLIADAMTVRKFTVFHISGSKSSSKHVVTKFAKIKGKEITYP